MDREKSIAIDNPQDKGRISYTYSAGGVKLRTVHENDMNVQTAAVMSSAPFSSSTTHTTTTDYVGNKVYEDGSLKRILVDGGYIENNTYYFHITDHLGNNRTVVKADGNPAQRSHYYPFGMSYAEGTGQDSQPYKYNGKELDKMHGLNLYDYSARYYEPAIGRFTTVDPHAENYYSWSPYNYVGNNPIRRIDPDGKDWGDFIRGIGQGFTGTFKSIGNAISDLPGTAKTLYNDASAKVARRNQQVRDGNIGGILRDMAVDVGDKVTLGQVSATTDLANAVATDINGGDGSNTGRVVGGSLANAAIGAIGTKAAQGVGGVLSKMGSNIGKTSNVVLKETTKTSFFDGTKYTNKVRGQMKLEDYHAFPESVKAFENSGKVSNITGGDGVTRQKLEIPGSYKGRIGNFEFIKESDGSINHRLFKSN